VTDTLTRTGLSKWRNTALYAIAALVTAASLAAFTESYRGLYYWSAEHGLSGFWAYAWPIQLDAFIAVGELALFVALADRWRKRSRILAWSVTIIGAAVSTAGNVGHMAGHSGWSMVTAGVPPVAAAAMLMVALGILKHVTETGKAAEPVVVAGPGPAEPVEVPAVSPGPATTTVKQPGTKKKTLTVAQQAALLDRSPRQVARWRKDGSIDGRLAAVTANGNGRH
jgi:Protein of unknown function (DUF2637)